MKDFFSTLQNSTLTGREREHSVIGRKSMASDKMTPIVAFNIAINQWLSIIQREDGFCCMLFAVPEDNEEADEKEEEEEKEESDEDAQNTSLASPYAIEGEETPKKTHRFTKHLKSRKNRSKSLNTLQLSPWESVNLMLAAMFSGILEKMEGLIETSAQVDPFMPFRIQLDVEDAEKKYRGHKQENDFVSRVLTSLGIKAHTLFQNFLRERSRSIEATRCNIRQCGILDPFKDFIVSFCFVLFCFFFFYLLKAKHKQSLVKIK